jgi:UDP-N-acetylglucosamine--N-acetylmuramyl-(pentapeptide) pyrophosphoryl-undecaprenol N-acetylglucosamine transferase
MTTVLIAGGGTGGHLMPALAIADAIRRTRPEVRVVLIGAERGLEGRVLPGRGVPFHLLPVEPLYRRNWWRNLRWLFLGPRVVRQALAVLEQERPDVVLGTGGYAAGPVVWLAARRGYPTAVLEQDAVPGLTTRLLARSARHIYLAVPEAERRLPRQLRAAVFVTGAPIEAPRTDPEFRAEARARFGLNGRSVVLVLGGSQGALAINAAVAEWIGSGGCSGVQLLWVTGPATHQRFRHLHAPPDVQVFDFLDPIAPAYAVADLAVTRAGSMTLAELSAWGIPAILIPLPSAAANHQLRNAQACASAGAAVLLPQDELDGARLGREVADLVRDPPRLATMGQAARGRGKPEATSRIVALLGSLSGGW